MTTYSLDVLADDRLSLSFDKQYDGESLSRCMSELAPLLLACLDAEASLSSLDKHTSSNRHKAIAAVRLKHQYHLECARNLIEKLGQLASGAVSASQLGFPEFDDIVEGKLPD